jgi:hypothetical protein
MTEAHEAQQDQDQVLVIDVTHAMTASDSALVLNAACDRGYHIHRALEWPNGVRVILVQSGKKTAGSSLAAKEAQALQFLRDNREMSASQLEAAFKAIGFVRKSQWINLKRAEIISAERKAIKNQ